MGTVIETGTETVTAIETGIGIEIAVVTRIGMVVVRMTVPGSDTTTERTTMIPAANGDTKLHVQRCMLYGNQGLLGGFLRFPDLLYHPVSSRVRSTIFTRVGWHAHHRPTEPPTEPCQQQPVTIGSQHSQTAYPFRVVRPPDFDAMAEICSFVLCISWVSFLVFALPWVLFCLSSASIRLVSFQSHTALYVLISLG